MQNWSMEIKYWFDYRRRKELNSSIILLCVKEKNIIKKIKNLIQDDDIDMLPLGKLTKEILNNKIIAGKNIITYIDKELSLVQLQIFANDINIKVLVVTMDEMQFRYYLHRDVELKMPVPIYILQNRQPKDVIASSEGIHSLRTFIDYFITSDEICKVMKKSIEIFLYRNKSIISSSTILHDIEFLQYRSILTSRLAIFIYKIYTFEYNASDKEIGLYFSKYYGRSKVVNCKKFSVKNVKGYIIKGLNLGEQRVRHDIAKNLKELGVNMRIIEKATGIYYNE